MEEPKSCSDKLKAGEKPALVGTIACALLAILKATVGFLFGSIILISDALNSVSDVLAGVVSWFGLRVSQKKPDERFPYGYYKAENFATLMVSGFICYAAVVLSLEGYSKLFVLSERTIHFEVLGAALISVVVSLFLSRYLIRIGRKIDSQSLIAHAKERRIDIVTSSIVFLAIILTFFNIPYVEGIITMIISFLALSVGLNIGKDSAFALMDVSPSKEIEEKVKQIISSNAGVEGFEGLRLRKAGPSIFGEVKVKIRKQIDVKRAHEIAESMEYKIKNEINAVESFVVHIEPYEAEEQKVAIPILLDTGLTSEVARHFGKAEYFMFVTADKNKKSVVSYYVKESPYREYVKAGHALANFVIKEKIDALIIDEIGDIAFHTLRDQLVDIFKVKGDTVEETVRLFLEERLERLTEPTIKEEPYLDRAPPQGLKVTKQ